MKPFAFDFLRPSLTGSPRRKLSVTAAALGLWTFCALATAEWSSARVPEPGDDISPAAARALEAKIQVLSNRDAKPGAPYPPVVITEKEANSYLKLRGHEFIPAGVDDTEIHIQADGVSGTADVDFNQLNQGSPKSDDWGSKVLTWIFKGRQRVSGKGKLETSNGQGTLTIESVTIGNSEVPGWLVNLLLENYVQARYKIDLTKPFTLPDHVTRIELGAGQATFHRSANKNQ